MRFDAGTRATLRARILRNVAVHPLTGCWIWRRRANNSGYGVINVRVDGRSIPVPLFVHRVAYWVFKRMPPHGRHVAHSIRCVSQRCCNPDHLRATTQSSKERDKKRAARWRRRNLREIHPPVHLQADEPHRRAA
jgi:ribulose 1,5-bisphosphate carboxylase large subunit-like protein